jgi:hypothetical protein
MFAVTGVFLLLKSVEGGKVRGLKLFFACFLFACAVGSRPNLILVSLLVPLVLWRYRSWKLLLFVAIPYAVVAIPMCIYNYVRFESITEFGLRFTIGYGGGFGNPISKMLSSFIAVVSYLALPNTYSFYFPFVEPPPLPEGNHMTLGAFMSKQYGSGFINFPIVLCLFYLFKKGFRLRVPETLRLPLAFFIVGTCLLLSVTYVNPFHGRYMADFTVFFVLSSLFCAYYWCNDRDSVHRSETRIKVTYVLLAVSILVGLFLFVSGDYEFSTKDPALYRYLERSLGIFRDV